MNSMYSDLIFIVEGKEIPAHRNIVAMRSSYFKALLYGGLAETTQSKINLKAPLEAFKALLKYMYTGCMSLDEMNVVDILDSLGLAHEYGFEALVLAISTHLIKIVSQTNCCEFFDTARLYNLESLVDVCIKFMDQNATDLLVCSSFKTLSLDSLCALLERDSFYAPEVEIFKAVQEWYKNNPDANIEVIEFLKLQEIPLNLNLTA